MFESLTKVTKIKLTKYLQSHEKLLRILQLFFLFKYPAINMLIIFGFNIPFILLTKFYILLPILGVFSAAAIYINIKQYSSGVKFDYEENPKSNSIRSPNQLSDVLYPVVQHLASLQVDSQNGSHIFKILLLVYLFFFVFIALTLKFWWILGNVILILPGFLLVPYVFEQLMYSYKIVFKA